MACWRLLALTPNTRILTLNPTLLLSSCLLLCLPSAFGQQSTAYQWPHGTDGTVAGRIAVPKGFERTAVEKGSFAGWLRHLPLKPENAPVLLFNGSRKANQSVHAAVIDIDAGTRDLQQCADAVIRLRAEYLYSRKAYDEIRFNFTSGDTAAYVQWRNGFRPEVRGNNVRWVKKADADSSYTSFRQYLDTVFTYAGSLSLSRELDARRNVADIEAGDVFIRGGSPGHAVLVIDTAAKKDTGEKIFLLAQSYMPAQDIHILKNPNDSNLSPWYLVRAGDALQTPEWAFAWSDLMRFDGNGKQGHGAGSAR